MTSVREEIKENLKYILAEKAVLKVSGKVLDDLRRAVTEMWGYLDSNEASPIPISYDMIVELFGSMDRTLTTEVLKDALQNRIQKRLNEALEDHKARKGSGQLNLEIESGS